MATWKHDTRDADCATPDPGDASRGLVQGGRGGPEAELLEDGQEEVFSRSEVERGAIEHSSGPEGQDEAEARRRRFSPRGQIIKTAC
jgi:hypothetical protein